MEKHEFQIQLIENLESGLYLPDSFKPEELNEFQFEIKLNQNINPDQKVIVVICTIEVYGRNKQFRLGNIRIACHYQVPGLENFRKNKKKYDIPEILSTTLNSITLSTARGCMFFQFKGTFLHFAVLPVMDPKSLKINTQ